MIALFFAAFGLGFVFNAAPGAVFAETLRQGVRGGFRPAVAVQLGSLVGDASWALLGLAGVGLMLQLENLRVPIGLLGVGYLLWLAVDSWRTARREIAVGSTGEGALIPGSALRSGMVISLTNPVNIAYWAAMGSAMGAVGVAAPRAADYATFFAGFMASSVVWCFVCALLIDRLFRRAGAGWASFTYRLCAVAFLALALASLRELWLATSSPGAIRAPSTENSRSD
jgi:chemosensory pili system protein ChpE/L-lysine exporter family protein LysE/ArgO